MENVYEQFFVLKYYGGWSFIEAYNLPVGLRTWFLEKLKDQIEKENEHVDFILIENKPHDEVKHIKQSCDILIDQVHNRGGWGYGMNSVEALRHS